MDTLDDVEGYLILAAQECDKLYDSHQEDPDQTIAELENTIHEALGKIAQIKQNQAD